MSCQLPNVICQTGFSSSKRVTKAAKKRRRAALWLRCLTKVSILVKCVKLTDFFPLNFINWSRDVVMMDTIN